MPDVSLDTLIKHKISLLSPADGAKTWCAQVWMFENNFLVEHADPKVAVQMCLDELVEKGLA